MTDNSAKLEIALRRAEGLANICNDLHARLAASEAARAHAYNIALRHVRAATDLPEAIARLEALASAKGKLDA